MFVLELAGRWGSYKVPLRVVHLVGPCKPDFLLLQERSLWTPPPASQPGPSPRCDLGQLSCLPPLQTQLGAREEGEEGRSGLLGSSVSQALALH